MRYIVLLGSATPPGRTLTMATTLAACLRSHASRATVDVIDLADVAFECADGRPLAQHDATIRDAVAAIAAADAVAIASPVYRATYTGVFKNFLDIVPFEALAHKPVGLAVLAGSLHHYLGVDAALRGVLAWYGAVALPTSVYLTGADFDERKALGERASAEIDGLAATLVKFAHALKGTTFAPAPIAEPRA